MFHHRDPAAPNSADPLWNESMYFSFCVPEREINGFVYCFHRPNIGLSCGGPAMWDSSGSMSWDCIYYDWNWLQALPAGAEATTFELESSMTLRAEEALMRYAMSYDRNGFELDLRWTAAIEPHGMSVADQMQQTGNGHYEQHGRITGSVRMDGSTFEIDCWSLHDRSWGPRRLGLMPGGNYSWAAADDGSAWHAVGFHPELEGSEGYSDLIIGGYLYRDETVADLVNGTRSIIDRDSLGRPTAVVIDASDALGRDLHAEGRLVNWLDFNGYPDQLSVFGGTQWLYDGQLAQGEDWTFYPLPEARRVARSRLAQRRLKTAAGS
ncbi:hypothetical protein BST14_24940 [Mycobacterium arosiense ATCC BAA-1401 = DSM 45069]|uniref:DUF7065 domain-containing protein n=1 Tax=Mycobacterium arosiense ATCC BAA-1401 = DSM 45069 TaxID=1265311 RepID=A0A1W9Z6S4_MYCAI|nr:hypothetical protein BST14_24940 [Mycobacterium arosiense ATCC BAA-1401 = DSM 45069]